MTSLLSFFGGAGGLGEGFQGLMPKSKSFQVL